MEKVRRELYQSVNPQIKHSMPAKAETHFHWQQHIPAY